MTQGEKLGILKEILGQAEANLAQAKKLIAEMMGISGTDALPKIDQKKILEKAQELASIQGKQRIIQGIFNGRSMVAPDGSEYPVPANYASKSKIVEGDSLKLTISEDGSFIYKQIGPTERKKLLGVLSQDEKGEFHVLADSKKYKVLLASVTYFKGEPGDEVSLVVPKNTESEWGAIENILKKTELSEIAKKKEITQAEADASSKEEEEKEVVPGQIIDDLDSDLEDSLEGLVDE